MSSTAAQEPLVEVKDVRMYFGGPGRFGKKRPVFRAVDGVSLSIGYCETLGLVGESGCGKTTLGRIIMKLYDPTGGEVRIEGEDLQKIDKKRLRALRRDFQIIFQDPASSLNPRKTIRESVLAPLDAYGIGTPDEREEKVRQTLAEVGIAPDSIEKYPHELSGGQRQRVAIARAIILDPKLIVCDEPVSALDVSIRSQVLNLMKKIQAGRNVSYLFISHDLSVVRYLCSRVAVMYLGQIVEYGTKEEVFDHPQHPYTQALLSAIPIPDVDRKMDRIVLQGEVPSPANPPSGCHFRTRCPYATDRCAAEEPHLTSTGGMHQVACFLKYDRKDRESGEVPAK